MTSEKPNSAPKNTTAGATLSVEERLIDAHRPLLFSRMPRMLRGDGTIGGSLQHQFRFFRALRPDRGAVSARRWKAALLRSRIVRGHRGKRGRAD